MKSWRMERLRRRAGEWRGRDEELENGEVEDGSWRMNRLRRRAGE